MCFSFYHYALLHLLFSYSEHVLSSLLVLLPRSLYLCCHKGKSWSTNASVILSETIILVAYTLCSLSDLIHLLKLFYFVGYFIHSISEYVEPTKCLMKIKRTHKGNSSNTVSYHSVAFLSNGKTTWQKSPVY